MIGHRSPRALIAQPIHRRREEDTPSGDLWITGCWCWSDTRWRARSFTALRMTKKGLPRREPKRPRGDFPHGRLKSERAGARSALRVLHLLVHLTQLGEFLVGRLLLLARIGSHRLGALGRQLAADLLQRFLREATDHLALILGNDGVQQRGGLVASALAKREDGGAAAALVLILAEILHDEHRALRIADPANHRIHQVQRRDL